MTKKDFRAMAASIAEIKNGKQRKAQAETFGRMCAASNPRFNWGRWNKACNVRER
jgi:hypothetical protein